MLIAHDIEKQTFIGKTGSRSPVGVVRSGFEDLAFRCKYAGEPQHWLREHEDSSVRRPQLY